MHHFTEGPFNLSPQSSTLKPIQLPPPPAQLLSSNIPSRAPVLHQPVKKAAIAQSYPKSLVRPSASTAVTSSVSAALPLARLKPHQSVPLLVKNSSSAAVSTSKVSSTGRASSTSQPVSSAAQHAMIPHHVAPERSNATFGIPTAFLLHPPRKESSNHLIRPQTNQHRQSNPRSQPRAQPTTSKVQQRTAGNVNAAISSSAATQATHSPANQLQRPVKKPIEGFSRI